MKVYTTDSPFNCGPCSFINLTGIDANKKVEMGLSTIGRLEPFKASSYSAFLVWAEKHNVDLEIYTSSRKLNKKMFDFMIYYEKTPLKLQKEYKAAAEKRFNALNKKFSSMIKNLNDPIKKLNKLLSDGNRVAVLASSFYVKNKPIAPHWIVAYKREGDKYHFICSIKGIITLSKKELLKAFEINKAHGYSPVLIRYKRPNLRILVIGDFHGKVPVKLRRAISKEDFDLIIGLGDYAGIEEWRPYILYLFGLEDKAKRKSPVEFFGEKEFADLMERDFKGGEKALDFLSGLGVPFISIFGNGDDEWYNYPFDKGLLELDSGRKKYLSKLKNFRDITYGSCNFSPRDDSGDSGDVSILGLGGYVDVKENYDEDSLGYLNVLKRLDKTQKKLRKLTKGLNSDGKIFVFHYPMRGIFDVVKEKGNKYQGKSIGIDSFREVVEREQPGLVLCGHMHEYQGKKKLGKSVVVNPGAACEGKCAFVDFDEVLGKVKRVKFVK